MGHIKRSDLSSVMVLIPTNKELQEIGNQIKSKIDKVILNYKQIATLETLCDALLPKLISGMIRIKF
jgi:type I restriction enzyme, S subunit